MAEPYISFLIFLIITIIELFGIGVGSGFALLGLGRTQFADSLQFLGLADGSDSGSFASAAIAAASSSSSSVVDLCSGVTCSNSGETCSSGVCKCGSSSTCVGQSTGSYCDAANNVCKCSASVAACSSGFECSSDTCVGKSMTSYLHSPARSKTICLITVSSF